MLLRLALIDNHDSYTFNLSHLFARANGVLPTTIRADAYPTLSSLIAAQGPFDAYILSPGPGTPHRRKDFPPLERDILAANIPVLGVCLGHQALCAQYGAKVSHAPAGPVHGVVSVVSRAPAADHCPLWKGLPSSFEAVRYHSLTVAEPLPAILSPTAWAEDVDGEGCVHRVLMAVRHRNRPLFGVQFHPESVGTELGLMFALNFVRLARAFGQGTTVERPIGKRGVETGGKGVSCGIFQTMVRQLKYVAAESADLFVALYGGCSVSFWLDSSSAVRLGSSVSRRSSPELVAEKEDEERVVEIDSDSSRRGHYSIMGACNGPLSEVVTYDVADKCVTVLDSLGQRKVTRHTTIFDHLEASLRHRYTPQHPDLPIEMNGGYVGFFGYELKADADGVKENRHKSDLPDAWFAFADRVIVIDHEEGSVFLVSVVREGNKWDESNSLQWFDEVSRAIQQLSMCTARYGVTQAFERRQRHGFREQDNRPLQFIPERSRSAYLSDIGHCLHEIRDGESYEVCLTNRLRTVLPKEYTMEPLDLYCALRLVNPAPYAAFLRLSEDVAVCCSSPERYLRISSAGVVESKPIKGTLPRGRSLQEDEALRNQLQNSVKDRCENMMIVDLVRNDLSRTCAVGSVQVPKLMDVESYATVHQLVSTVTGVLSRPGDTVKCIRAAYPMGSMTGAPKVRTMEIIDRLERSSRGIYSGSIGYLSLCGAADLNVVIRTAILKGREVEIGVGGAIVALSRAEEEYEEMILKGRALMQALALRVTGLRNFEVLEEGDRRNAVLGD